MNDIIIKLKKDNLSPILEKMYKKSLKDESLKKILQSLLDISKFFMKIATINIDNSSTSASEIFISLEPTNGFRSFSSTFLTGDFDRLVLEHKEFLSKLEKI